MLCVRAYEDSGLSAEYDSVGGFIEERKKHDNVQKEWDAAYAAEIEETSNMPLRDRSGIGKQKIKDNVEAARKKVVETYEEDSVECLSRFRAVALEKFEQDDPGKAERTGARKTRMKCDGKMRDVVLLPKLPDNEWDVDLKSKTGVKLSEQHEDGSKVLRQGQAAAKFQRLSRDGLASAVASKENVRYDMDRDVDDYGDEECGERKYLGVTILD